MAVSRRKVVGAKPIQETKIEKRVHQEEKSSVVPKGNQIAIYLEGRYYYDAESYRRYDKVRDWVSPRLEENELQADIYVEESEQYYYELDKLIFRIWDECYSYIVVEDDERRGEYIMQNIQSATKGVRCELLTLEEFITRLDDN